MRQSKVFTMNDDLVNRSGPVTVEGVWESARTLPPEVFGEEEVTGRQ